MGRALGRDVKDGEPLELVAEEVQAHRLLGVRRPDVHDAAAHRDLGAVLDELLAPIPHGDQALDEDWSRSISLRGASTKGSSGSSGESTWAIERAEATMTRGPRPLA